MDAQGDGETLFVGFAAGFSETTCARNATNNSSLCDRKDV